MSQAIGVGVVGLGYWGPNLARNFDRLTDCELVAICDGSSETVERFGGQFPNARRFTSVEEFLSAPGLDAVAVATPVTSHGDICLQVLEAGKHCFVEKPLAESVAKAEEVLKVASRKQRCLMVGHLLEYHPGVAKLKEISESGHLGDTFYIYSNRLNLGKLRADENALWSLGAHDVSVVLHLVDGEEPEELQAFGESFMQPGVEDVVFCYMRFASGVAAHLHLSWLDPHKERRLTVVGSKRMATFDDMELERKVTVYDKGFDQSYASYGEYIARSGDIWSPRVSNEEPLRLELRHFLDRITDGSQPLSDGASGLRVVRVLEALDRSLRTRAHAASV